MKKLVLVSIIIFCVSFSFAQNISKPFYKLSFFTDSLVTVHDYGGNVIVYQDSKLEQLMTNFSIAYKRQIQKVWRIQIYFGIGRQGRIQAQNIKGNFESKHPGIPTVLVFEEPYFKVRVGEFSNRLDAERLKALLSEDYDKIFIIEDRIK